MRLSKGEQRKIAKERIDYLFLQAEKIFSKKSELADRYVEMALKLRDKFKAKVSREQKRMFCKECFAFLFPGKTSTVRIKNKTLLIHCKKCGAVRKFNMRKK